MATELKIGDQVRFLDEVGMATLVEIRANGTALLLDEDGFDIEYPINKLVKATNDESYEIGSLPPKVYASEKASILKKEKKEVFFEVDLHIHALLNDWRRMSNTEIVRYQLSHLQMWLEKAYNQRVSKVIVIHGVGEGVLRHEVHRLLKEYVHIEYFDAPYAKYGMGATEVRLHFN